MLMWSRSWSESWRAAFARDDASCIVLVPELETVLVPVWDRVAALMASKRGRSVPLPSQVLAAMGRVGPNEVVEQDDWAAVLARTPKECFIGLLRVLNLRHQPALYDEIAREVSLPLLKEGDTARQLGGLLEQWFGATAASSGGNP